jgi:hypothetical protein
MSDLTPQQIADAVDTTLRKIAKEFAGKRKRASSARAARASKPARRARTKKRKTNDR